MDKKNSESFIFFSGLQNTPKPTERTKQKVSAILIFHAHTHTMPSRWLRTTNTSEINKKLNVINHVFSIYNNAI